MNSENHACYVDSSDERGSYNQLPFDLTESGAKRALPSVSPKWANMPHRDSMELSDADLLLMETVRAEQIFVKGLRDRGGCELSMAEEGPFKDPLKAGTGPLKDPL